MFDRWVYLQDGRPRVGRGRHLFDYFELGSRVELSLELENTRPRVGLRTGEVYRGTLIRDGEGWGP
jgi:hypothetical protein